MTTPDLPPLPDPFVPLYGDERRKWADQMRAYGDARAAAAVLAERESRAMLVARLSSGDQDTMLSCREVLALLNDCDMLANRTKPPKEQQP